MQRRRVCPLTIYSALQMSCSGWKAARAQSWKDFVMFSADFSGPEGTPARAGLLLTPLQTVLCRTEPPGLGLRCVAREGRALSNRSIPRDLGRKGCMYAGFSRFHLLR